MHLLHSPRSRDTRLRMGLYALRRALAMAALSFAALTLTIFSPGAWAEPLRLSVSKTPLSLPVYVAHQKGYFAEQGLDVQVTECMGGHRCLKELFDGKADVATVGDLPIVFSSFERTDYTVLGTMVTTSEDLKLVAHARAGIARPLDLAGKRIGAVRGASSQYFLELYLLTVGIDPQSVKVVFMQPEQMLQALQVGDVDAIATWEPFAYLALKALGSSAVVLKSNAAYMLTFNLVAQRRVTEAKNADLVRFLHAIERAERFIHDQPEAAKSILRTTLQVDHDFIDWVWKGMAFRLSMDQSLITTMEGEARWARREGHVNGATPNFLGLLHSAPLKAVKPSAVGVAR